MAVRLHLLGSAARIATSKTWLRLVNRRWLSTLAEGSRRNLTAALINVRYWPLTSVY
jgi:hypothetical protein